MPVARFEMPDGRIARFEVPEGTTPEQAQALMQQAMPSLSAGGQKPLTRTEKIATGMADPIHGGAQLLTQMLPEGVVQAGNRFNNWLSDKTGLVPRLPEGGVNQQVRQREDAYQARRAAAGEEGLDGWRLLGNVASPANIGISRVIPNPVGLGGRVLAGSAGGAASAALAPVNSDDFAGEKTRQMMTGAVGGAVTPMVVSGASRIISPKASVNPDVQLLRREGVRPTVGQTLGGAWNTAEEKFASVPLVGDAIANQRRRAVEEFNRAALNRVTSKVGQQVDDVGVDGVRQAGDLVSDAYEAAKSQMGAFRIDQTAKQELNNIRMMARSGLEGKERKWLDSYFKDYINSKNGLTAEAFKEMDSKLGNDIRRLTSSQDAYQQNLGDALKEIQRIVRENAMRANPKAAEAMKAADSAYANLVRVERAATGAKGSDGVFTPGQLLTAVRQSDSSVRDRATARGTALMQDLAGAGQNVLGNRVPDSGTAGRSLAVLGAGVLATAGAGAAGVISPMAAGLGGLGLALYTTPLQRLLGTAVSARPEYAQTVGNALQKTTPSLVPFGSQIGLGLLN